ncbi:MAG TPA: hypothetical protein VFM34_07245 [Moraxellaceae bacterium]|nr:hypothetical protein [Moraxellaceae bacterium]
MSLLLPAGRWALGADAQEQAEQLVAQAQHEGLRTGWLSSSAGFLSNLTILENLRLVYDWLSGDGVQFESLLRAVLAELRLGEPEWLTERPARLGTRPLLQARVVRLLLLRPALVVLDPASLAKAGPALADQLIAGLDGACLLLLADSSPEWPAWSPDSGATVPRPAKDPLE